jgi:hypothetical protein
VSVYPLIYSHHRVTALNGQTDSYDSAKESSNTGNTMVHHFTTWQQHRKNGPRSGLFIALIAALLASPLAHAQDTGGAEALADKMLDRLGGREAWAGLKNTINGSQQNRAGEPTVVYSVITMDFERPRFRIETTAQNLHLIRVIDGDDSWRLRMNGNIEGVPADRFDDEMRWYGAHLYRTIHRIAARDPALSLGLAEDGRLEVFAGEERIMWLRLDAKAEPYSFGFYDSEVGSLSGPWDFVRDGIHHPRWISSSDGTWRAGSPWRSTCRCMTACSRGRARTRYAGTAVKTSPGQPATPRSPGSRHPG